MKAAKQLSIKTAYVQHAPVTREFPPLEVDLALLDGPVSVERYAIKKQ